MFQECICNNTEESRGIFKCKRDKVCRRFEGFTMTVFNYVFTGYQSGKYSITIQLSEIVSASIIAVGQPSSG
jgi:hypothetical protein